MPKKPKTILLVDDNPVAQRMTAKVFSNAGYQVILAWNEAECLEMAKTRRPDAILMDIIFPDGDGRYFVQKLKADPSLKKIPVIFATNTLNVKEDDGGLTITIGEDVYRAFAKPLHYPKLLSTVRKEINRGLLSVAVLILLVSSAWGEVRPSKAEIADLNRQIKLAETQAFSDLVRENNVTGQKRKEWLYSMVCLNMAYLQFGGGNDRHASDLNKLIRQKLKEHISVYTLKRLGTIYSLQ